MYELEKQQWYSDQSLSAFHTAYSSLHVKFCVILNMICDSDDPFHIWRKVKEQNKANKHSCLISEI